MIKPLSNLCLGHLKEAYQRKIFVGIFIYNVCQWANNSKNSNKFSRKYIQSNNYINLCIKSQLFFPTLVCIIYQNLMKQQVRTDEQLQALLSQFEVIEPHLRCNRQKIISRMCVNPQCLKLSLICEENDCLECGFQNHLHCPSLKLKSISTILRQTSHKYKDFTIDICKIENKFIEQIHGSRCDIIKQYYLGDLQQKSRKIIEEIYKKKNSKCLTGKESEEFYKKLHASSKKSHKNINLILTMYEQFMKTIIDQISNMKKKLYKCFVKATELSSAAQSNQNIQIDSNILKSSLSVDLNKVKIYDKLLSRIAKPEHTQFLLTALNNPKRLQLLYRGSENGFKAKAFHQKCDNISNTLTIARTEFGKTIAGFTKYTWNAVKSGDYVNDAGKHAFLLSLDLKQKMLPINDHQLIFCHTGWGPVFGDGKDFAIGDQCNKNSNSCANFPFTYNYQGANKYTRSQDSYRAFSGATIGYRFKIEEYEVFRVIYE